MSVAQGGERAKGPMSCGAITGTHRASVIAVVRSRFQGGLLADECCHSAPSPAAIPIGPVMLVMSRWVMFSNSQLRDRNGLLGRVQCIPEQRGQLVGGGQVVADKYRNGRIPRLFRPVLMAEARGRLGSNAQSTGGT
jgi:hypothetical protein